MKILFIGDIYGRSGRDALAKHLPSLKEKLQPDCIIVNGENAAHGNGITPKICEEIYTLGVDVITTGNHVWDQREIIPYIDRDPNLLRPANFPLHTPGHGFVVKNVGNGQKICVINAMARLFMEALDDPFTTVSKIVQENVLKQKTDAIFIDFHGEATSEKMAFAHYFDGKVSAVVGTHTHIPTADAHILEKGTAYQTDAGMTGDYNSVIGVEKSIPVHRFTRQFPSGEKKRPADGEATLCGTFIETSNQTGLAKQIAPLRIGGKLSQTILDF